MYLKKTIYRTRKGPKSDKGSDKQYKGTVIADCIRCEVFS